jgi:hypothetical protein
MFAISALKRFTLLNRNLNNSNFDFIRKKSHLLLTGSGILYTPALHTCLTHLLSKVSAQLRIYFSPSIRNIFSRTTGFAFWTSFSIANMKNLAVQKVCQYIAVTSDQAIDGRRRERHLSIVNYCAPNASVTIPA